MDEQAQALYDRLTAPFEPVHRVPIGGGGDAPYLSGEQVVTRLNETLTPLGWTFTVVEHGIHAEADELWALGRLAVTHRPDSEGRLQPCDVVRMQFGSNKIKRAKASGQPLDIGFDLKGAATDALKKCATLIGIGLDLTQKEGGATSGTGSGGGGLDWTAFWGTLKRHGLGPEDVERRYGQAAPGLVRQGYTLERLLSELAPQQ